MLDVLLGSFTSLGLGAIWDTIVLDVARHLLRLRQRWPRSARC